MKKALFLILCIPALAYAQPRWVRLGSNANGSTFFIDITHAVVQNDNTAWVKVNMGKPISLNGKKATSVVSKIEFNCQTKQIRRIDNTFYSAKQLVIGRQTDSNAPLENVVPGGFDDIVLDVVCE